MPEEAGAATVTPSDEGEAAAVETPAVTTPPADESSSAAPSTPEPVAEDEALAVPFKIDELPEGEQEIARRLEAQFKRAHTQARQKDAEETREARELWEKLQDEETQEQALLDLADQLGYEPATGDEPPPTQQSKDGEPESQDPAVQALIERDRARTEREQAESLKAQQTVVRNHIADGLTSFVEGRGEGYEMPQEASTFMTLHALQQPGADGLPDIADAVEAYEALEAEIISKYVARKSGDTPDLSGGSGVSQEDLSTPKGRLAAAQRIASRGSR